jgi:glycine/D-amino acid oxidase-like deaminating enzyme
LGVQFVFNSVATSLEKDDARQQFTSIKIETKEQQPATRTLPCSAVVIAGGPWSSRIFSSLFPESNVKLRMNNTRSAGNHALIRNPRWTPTDDEEGVHQVFLNNVVPGTNRLDITSFLGGSLYIGGWGARPERLPVDADAVQPQPDEIEAMLEVARQYLRFEPGEKLELLSTGRCYRPLAVPNRPVITKVEWSLLGDPDSNAKLSRGRPKSSPSPVTGGLYINTGHNSDGVTLGPGSGKLMSDLLLGRTPSVPISEFRLDPDDNQLCHLEPAA